MTARFFRRDISWTDYRAAIDLVPPPGIDAPEAAYNITPSQHAPILRRAPEGEYAPRHAIQIAPAFWGLVPVWWKQPLSEKKFFGSKPFSQVNAALAEAGKDPIDWGKLPA